MGAGDVTAAPTATGQLKYELVDGETAATYVYATYPLKFLHPRGTVRQGYGTYVTYILGYGGGLVGGDKVSVKCELAPDTTVVLTTQATTKVFKSEDTEHVAQTFDLKVDTGATLAFLPDPVTCFEHARYRQTQAFRLEKGASLVFVDWLTSGRKRNYLTTGAVLEGRMEILEHWDFDEYDNTAEIFVDGERLLTDRVRLADDEGVKLRDRMQGMHVLGLLVIVGAQLQQITDLLLEFSTRKRLHNARDITPQGRLASQNDFPGVIASASPLGDGVIARFCGENAEVAMHFVKTMLAPLRDIIGFSPYQDNR